MTPAEGVAEAGGEGAPDSIPDRDRFPADGLSRRMPLQRIRCATLYTTGEELERSHAGLPFEAPSPCEAGALLLPNEQTALTPDRATRRAR